MRINENWLRTEWIAFFNENWMRTDFRRKCKGGPETLFRPMPLSVPDRQSNPFRYCGGFGQFQSVNAEIENEDFRLPMKLHRIPFPQSKENKFKIWPAPVRGQSGIVTKFTQTLGWTKKILGTVTVNNRGAEGGEWITADVYKIGFLRCYRKWILIVFWLFEVLKWSL